MVPHGCVIGRPCLVVCSVASERVWPVADAFGSVVAYACDLDARVTGLVSVDALDRAGVFPLFLGELARVFGERVFSGVSVIVDVPVQVEVFE